MPLAKQRLWEEEPLGVQLHASLGQRVHGQEGSQNRLWELETGAKGFRPTCAGFVLQKGMDLGKFSSFPWFSELDEVTAESFQTRVFQGSQTVWHR